MLCLLCSPMLVRAGDAANDLKSLSVSSQETDVIPVAVASEIQETNSVRSYRSQPTSEDLDIYLVALSGQIADSVSKNEITRLILSGIYEQKMQYLADHAQGKTLILIRQSVSPDKGVCTWVTKTFCAISCAVPGVASSCYNSCKDIIVQSCN